MRDEDTTSALPEGRVREAGVRDTSINEDGLETSRSEPVHGEDAGTIGMQSPSVIASEAKQSQAQSEANGGEGNITPQSLTPTQALNLRVVDPACGSGSFLLGAYQYLLDWHLNYYLTHDPQSHTRGKNPPLVATEGGEYRLTTETKKRILTASIYGVDIDSQAVEVTKLSLLLKLLEGETGQLSLGFERVLPDLDQNIRCGNSLIGWDYFKGQMFPDEEEIQRVNPFDWQRAFPHVFAAGGFDAVIGNPPYIRIQTMETKDIQHFSKSYESAIGNYDIYCPFVEKGIRLINSNGLVSFIIPHRFFKTNYGLGLRKIITKGYLLQSIIDFDGFMVFSAASINTCVIVLDKQFSPRFYYAKVNDIHLSEGEMPDVLSGFLMRWVGINTKYEAGYLEKDGFSSQPWIFIMPHEKSIWKKLKHIEKTLSDYTSQIFQGLKTGGDQVFSVYSDSNSGKYMKIACPKDKREYIVESALFHPQYKGGDINRYKLSHNGRYVLFPYANGQLISKADFEKQYPLTMKYLLEHKSFLESRENGKMKGNQWYGYTRSQALTSMEQPKLLTPEYYAHPAFCLDSSGNAFFFGGGAGGYAIVPKGIKPEVLLGILNSKLVSWFMRKTSIRQYQTAYSFVKKYIEKIPIKPFLNKTDEDRFSRLVLSMLDLHSRQAVTPTEKEQLNRLESATDVFIDRMVYELYELAEEEIRIVEQTLNF